MPTGSRYISYANFEIECAKTREIHSFKTQSQKTMWDKLHCKKCEMCRNTPIMDTTPPTKTIKNNQSVEKEKINNRNIANEYSIIFG
jgi:hypothetical protein